MQNKPSEMQESFVLCYAINYLRGILVNKANVLKKKQTKQNTNSYSTSKKVTSTDLENGRFSQCI